MGYPLLGAPRPYTVSNSIVTFMRIPMVLVAVGYTLASFDLNDPTTKHLPLLLLPSIFEIK